MQINQNVIVISGAASGMGAACAHYFHERGAKLILIDISPELNQIALKLNAYPIIAPVNDASLMEKTLSEAFNQVGLPRVNINCAGIAPASRVLAREGTHSLEAFQRVIDINLNGTFNVLRLCAEAMSSADPLSDDERGVIINTASIAAFEGQIGQAAYSASKGGIVAMTLPLARELARVGIRVNCIAPGLVETPMLTNFPENVQQRLQDQTLFPHRLAKPREFARLCEHIIDNVILNGETIRMDGAVRLTTQ